ncbi:universal stress protein UspA [Sphingomonas sp. AAP5]|uniref:Universal stress protein n=1 Tax=Sphingomonas glacialis TaxID=658225 RepID=A0ABQ3L9S5_9SPHN|nr:MULTISPECIES: universal stress protein [Sphingomonas]QBM75471.1 universal stress protein UspA [Sphingomonas sp. AAP5]GHH07825.1 universal stress protein [Sphingomonas glacialis]
MKNVLLLVHDDTGQESRIQAALDLTRALDGHLSCVDVVVPATLNGDYYGIAAVGLLEDERTRESENKTEIVARLAREDVRWDWTDATGPLADSVLDVAKLADLIVLSRKLTDDRDPDMRDVASRVLMQARTPIVAVPDTLTRLALARVLIAWDGQGSAAATLRACVPLLALADAVEIFMARDGGERTEPTEAAEYLSRHGIHATIRTIDDGLTAPDRLIEAEAERFNADYILMGGYTHGRLLETFGGVTKRMLGICKLPLVLSH